MYCPNCGNQLPNTATMCCNCRMTFNNIYNMNQNTNQNIQPGINVDPRMNQPAQFDMPQRMSNRMLNKGFISQPRRQVNAQPRQQVRQTTPKNNSSSSAIAIIIILALLYGGYSGLKGSNKDNNNESSPSATNMNYEVETNVSDNVDRSSDKVSNNSDNQTEAAISSNKATESSDDFGVNLSEYNYITCNDLAVYSPNLVDQKVYFVTTVGEVDDEKIQVALDDGYMFTNCYTNTSYVGIINEDEKVVICGQVVGQDTYSFMGNSTELKDCKVVAKNTAADSYYASSSSDELQEYFYLTDEIANANEDEISEEEYKNLCQSYDYEDILRNEDNYKKKHTILTGRVDQIIEGWFGSYSIFIVDGNGDKWGCTYTYKDGESKMLEGDWVTIYGILDGTQNTTTVMGKQVTLPYIMIDYYE